LEFRSRVRAVLTLLRDQSRVPAAFLVGALNTDLPRGLGSM